MIIAAMLLAAILAGCIVAYVLCVVLERRIRGVLHYRWMIA